MWSSIRGSGNERVFFSSLWNRTKLSWTGTRDCVNTNEGFKWKSLKSGKVPCREEQPRAAGARCGYGKCKCTSSTALFLPVLMSRGSAKAFDAIVESTERKGKTRTSSVLGWSDSRAQNSTGTAWIRSYWEWWGFDKHRVSSSTHKIAHIRTSADFGIVPWIHCKEVMEKIWGRRLQGFCSQPRKLGMFSSLCFTALHYCMSSKNFTFKKRERKETAYWNVSGRH